MEIKDLEELQWKEAIATPKCEEMLAKAAKYYTDMDLTKQAEELVQKFRKMVKLLEIMPGIGTLEKNGMRSVIIKKYRYKIYYRENEKNLDILGIWHTSRGTEFEAQD